MSLHVLRLVAENMLRLKAVDITPQDNMVVLSGKNDAGKTSILNVIWIAMQWAASSKHLSNPIRMGEEKGYCMLDLGDFIVKRWFTLDEDDEEVTQRLVVENRNGDIIKRPQQLLDDLIGSLSYDPLEFVRADGKKRKQMLADILKINLADQDAQIAKFTEERKYTKRERNDLQAIINKIAPPTAEEPTKEESLLELVGKLEQVKSAIKARDAAFKKVSDLEERIVNMRADLANLERLFEESKQEFAKHNSDASLSNEEDRLTQQVHNIEKNNARAREVAQYFAHINKSQELDKKLDEIEVGIKEVKTKQTEALAAAELPINGLSITDDDILFNDLPLSQASTSEQWKVSLAIGMISNPKFRVLRIKDGSVLDRTNLQILRDIAKDQDFQVWIEMVDDSEKVGFYIENGEVKATNQCTV